MREVLSRLDSRELSEWIAFDRIEPLPEPWKQTGLLATLLAGLGGQKSKPEDWIPKPAQAQKLDPKATVNYLKAIFGQPSEE